MKTAVHPRGVTLMEGVIASALLGLTIVALVSALAWAHLATLRATRMSEAVARVTSVMEDIAAVPYALVNTNTYPVQYVTQTNGSMVILEYTMTTTVVEVSTPLLHKRVFIDYTWRAGNSTRHQRFCAIKTP